MIIGNSIQSVPKKYLQGTLLNVYNPFIYPSTGVVDIPVNTTTGWVLDRNAGTSPPSSLTVVDITDPDTQELIRGNKALRIVNGNTVFAGNEVIYTFAAPVDMTGKNFLIWIYLEAGEGITSWDKASGLYINVYRANGNYRRYLLGAVNVEYASSGWYAFSLTLTGYGYTTTGVVADVTAITKIGITVTNAVGDSPIWHLGMLSYLPNQPKAHICFMADHSYAAHYTVAQYLASKQMYGTFYIDANNGLTIEQLLEMQSMGHQVSVYGRDWGTTVDKIALLQTNQNWLKANGFLAYKHMVHGITSKMDESLWNTIVPAMCKTVGYTQRTLTSRYHISYAGRYNQFNAANKAAIITATNGAIIDGAKLGLLMHDCVGADYTAFTDYVDNTLIPLRDAGSLEVITIEQSYNLNKAIT